MSKGTYSHSNRHRMHEPTNHAMTPFEIETTRLKRDLIEAQTTITNLSYKLKAMRDELRHSRSDYQTLADDYIRMRAIQRRDTEIVEYMLSDDTTVSVYIKGEKYEALCREEIENVMEADPDYHN